MKIIDTNAGFGRWPFRKFPYRQPADLAEALRFTSEAWVSSTDAVLLPDPDPYDAELCEALRPFPSLRPVKTINPMLAGWERRLRRFHERDPLAGVKIYPSFHDYRVDGEPVAELAGVLHEMELPLLIAIRLEDERNLPRLMQVAPVEPAAILALAAQVPGGRIIVHGAHKLEAGKLLEGGPFCDIPWLDGAEILETLAGDEGARAGSLGATRLVFGSHTPFFYPEAAWFRLTGSRLPEAVKAAIAGGNLCVAGERARTAFI